MKKLALLILAIIFAYPSTAHAHYNPNDRQNNIFGIHIVDVGDIPDAASLVNSSGGDWGYVTLVIQENDRNHDKWQQVFDQMRRFHLIPIVRLATHLEGSSWVKPKTDDIDNWVSFLGSLNWPVENRYVVLFNEPNHAKEWGNSLEPEKYGAYVGEIAKKLKNSNQDFFVLPAGFDASAGNTGGTMDEYLYLQRVVRANPDFFSYLDGWSSHSYPNPNFSGSVSARGRGTLTTYQWEISMLQQMGLKKYLPIFITETGWIHSNGITFNPGYLTPEAVGDNLKVAGNTVWKDKNIIAVTPFLLNYQGQPFDHFSWKKLGVHEFYSQFSAYQSIGKLKGMPRQRETYTLTSQLIPKTLVSESRYTLIGTLKNTGQGILSWQDNYDIVFSGDSKEFVSFVEPLPLIEPKQEGLVTIHLQTPKKPGPYSVSLAIRHNGDTLKLEEATIKLAPPPSLTIDAQLGWKRVSTSSDTTILIYTEQNELLHKFSGIVLNKGRTSVNGLTNIIPGTNYRIVMLVPYYLPRQHISSISAHDTKISMKRLLPFDFNTDGKLTLSDIKGYFRLTSNKVLSLFI